MKKLKLNLRGVKALNKAEQRQINGGSESEQCPEWLPYECHCVSDEVEVWSCTATLQDCYDEC
mgnify:CR=1 FL=1